MPYCRPSSMAPSIGCSGLVRTTASRSEHPHHPVGQRHAREVEAPLRHRGEVGLLEGGPVVRPLRKAKAASRLNPASAAPGARWARPGRPERRAGRRRQRARTARSNRLDSSGLHSAASVSGRAWTRRGTGGGRTYWRSSGATAATPARRRLMPRFALPLALAALAMAAVADAGPQASSSRCSPARTAGSSPTRWNGASAQARPTPASLAC